MKESFCCSLQKEQRQGKGRRGEPTRSTSPENFFAGFGKHDEEREKLNVERKREYNHMLAEVIINMSRIHLYPFITVVSVLHPDFDVVLSV